MVLRFFVTLFAALFVVSLLPASHAADCSLNAISSRMANCASLQLNQLQTGQNIESIISKMCDSIDCSVACVVSTLESCVSSGISQVFDSQSYKVTMRYACQNFQGLLDGLRNCNIAGWNCFTTMISNISAATLSYLSSEDDAAYVADYCGASSAYRSCTATSPLAAGGTCTESQAQIINDVYDVYSSIEKCNIAHSSPLFATYGGDLDVSTCGSIRLGPFNFAISFFLVVLKFIY